MRTQKPQDMLQPGAQTGISYASGLDLVGPDRGQEQAVRQGGHVLVYVLGTKNCWVSREVTHAHTRAHPRVCVYLQISQSTEAFPGTKTEPKLRRAPVQGEGSAGTTVTTRLAVKLLKYFNPRSYFILKLREHPDSRPPRCSSPRTPRLPHRPTTKGRVPGSARMDAGTTPVPCPTSHLSLADGGPCVTAPPYVD